MSAVDLRDTHEILISEYELLERQFEQLRMAKKREADYFRLEMKRLREELKLALEEVDELQRLLALR